MFAAMRPRFVLCQRVGAREEIISGFWLPLSGKEPMMKDLHKALAIAAALIVGVVYSAQPHIKT